MKEEQWAIPNHDTTEFSPKKHRYCLCIPILNEGKRIQNQLLQTAAIHPEVDIIIADGGSIDGSLDHNLLKKTGVRTLLVKTGPGRLSAQLRMGLAYAMREGYQGVIIMDGNNKDDSNDIPKFLCALDNGFDHIQGSRFIPGGMAINNPPFRIMAVRWFHAPLISWAAGNRYTDTTNGFRAYSRTFLLDPRVAPFRNIFMHYELHYYLAIRAATLGYKCLEVPVTRSYPKVGPIPTKISFIKGNLKILGNLFKACLHRFDPY